MLLASRIPVAAARAKSRPDFFVRGREAHSGQLLAFRCTLLTQSQSSAFFPTLIDFQPPNSILFLPFTQTNNCHALILRERGGICTFLESDPIPNNCPRHATLVSDPEDVGYSQTVLRERRWTCATYDKTFCSYELISSQKSQSLTI